VQATRDGLWRWALTSYVVCDMRAQEELDRQHRTNTRQLKKQLQETQEDLCGTKAEKEELERAVTRGKERLNGLREYGDGWKKTFSDQILVETKELKMEEQIRVLETEIKHIVKKIKEVEKKNTLLEDRSSTLEETLKEGEKDLQAIVELRRQVYLHYRWHAFVPF
jgi:chromosome segregation ATPase